MNGVQVSKVNLSAFIFRSRAIPNWIFLTCHIKLHGFAIKDAIWLSTLLFAWSYRHNTSKNSLHAHSIITKTREKMWLGPLKLLTQQNTRGAWSLSTHVNTFSIFLCLNRQVFPNNLFPFFPRCSHHALPTASIQKQPCACRMVQKMEFHTLELVNTEILYPLAQFTVFFKIFSKLFSSGFVSRCWS